MLSKPAASDVAVRERLDARLDFLDDFVGVVATVHRQLPHDPVSVVVVVGVDGGVQTRPAVAVSVGVGAILNSTHGVQPLFNKYWTCLVKSASESGGKKEKVSNILLVLRRKREEIMVSKFSFVLFFQNLLRNSAFFSSLFVFSLSSFGLVSQRG